ncbi:hypothetical protein XENTR_v10015000 [Xenopus tropicalis]|nr:hypothetical protein XENTR_v10015000 [Xenopus tropicalis]
MCPYTQLHIQTLHKFNSEAHYPYTSSGAFTPRFAQVTSPAVRKTKTLRYYCPTNKPQRCSALKNHTSSALTRYMYWGAGKTDFAPVLHKYTWKCNQTQERSWYQTISVQEREREVAGCRGCQWPGSSYL